MVMIKGIEIDFDARTTKLDQAFRRLSAESRAVSAELRGVNSLMKMNPKSPVLAAQKTQLLAKSVKEAELRQRELNRTLNEANAAGVNKNSAAYRKLQREAELAKVKVEQLKREQLEWTASQSRIGKMSTALTNFGAKVNGVASKMKYLSLAAAGIGAAALKVGMDFDAGMSKVAAVSGASGQELDALRNKAKQMGAQTKFSATEAAEAMNYMAMAGWKTEDMLGGIEGIMNLAAASGEDLATTSDIVTDALTAFNLTASDSGHFADVLAAASSNANTNVSMMGETFKYAAPIAGSLGYSVEDVAESIGLMANAGIKSSQAGTSLRRIMTSLTKDFTVSGKKIGDVTIKTTKADGSMRKWSDIIQDTRKAFSGLSKSEQTTAAETLVGKNAMSGFLAIMNASPKDIKKLEDALGKADGAAKSMADTMLDNTKGSITILKSTLESAGISISETLAPMLTKVVNGIKDLVSKFNDLSPGTKDLIAKMVMVTAVGFPVLKLISGVSTGLGSLLKPVSLLVTKMGLASGKTGVFSSLLAKVPGPAKLAVGAVGALAGAIAIHEARIHGATRAYQQEKQAREEAIAQSMAEAGQADSLAERLFALNEVENKTLGQKATMKSLVEQLNEKVGGLNLKYDEEKDKLNQTKDAILKKVEAMKTEAEVAAYQQAITDAFKSRLSAEKKLEEATANLAAARKRYNELAKNPHVDEDEIQTAAQNVNAMQTAYDDAARAVADCDEEIDGYNNKILRAKGETKGLSNVMQYGSSSFEKLKKKAGQAGYAFSEDFIKMMRKGKIRVPRTVKGINDAIKFDKALRRAKAAGVDVNKRLSSGMKGSTWRLSDATDAIREKIKGGLDIDWTAFGVDITKGVASGMISGGALGALSGAMSTIASYTKKAGNKKFKRNSPAKIMYPLGEGVPEGIAAGMLRGRGFISEAMSKLAGYTAGANTAFRSTAGLDSGAMTKASFSAAGSVTNNITVSGAENPEEYGARLARQIKLQLRTV